MISLHHRERVQEGHPSSFGAKSLWWRVAKNLRSRWPVPDKAPCLLDRTTNTNHLGSTPSSYNCTSGVKTKCFSICFKIFSWPIEGSSSSVVLTPCRMAGYKSAAESVAVQILLNFRFTLFGLNKPSHKIKQLNTMKAIACFENFTTVSVLTHHHR